MNVMVRLAMSGARETMMAQSVNTHNLANASTAGFRADLVKFTEEAVDGSGESRLINAVDFTQGRLQATGRNLDVALNGEGWIAVQTPEGGEAYSRRGDLVVDNLGQLTNGSGQPILGNNGPIAVPPFSEIEIGKDGTISIQPLGQPPNSMAVVDRIKLVNVDNDQLFKGPDGMLRLPENVEVAASTETQLLSGTLESSNVNTIETMVRMIDLARRFESQIKMMETSEENDRSMTSVMRIS